MSVFRCAGDWGLVHDDGGEISGIAGQRHHVRRHRGLALGQRLAQALDGERIANRSTVAEQIGHRLGDTKPRTSVPAIFLCSTLRRSTSSENLAIRIGEGVIRGRQSLRAMAIQSFGGIWSVGCGTRGQTIDLDDVT